MKITTTLGMDDSDNTSTTAEESSTASALSWNSAAEALRTETAITQALYGLDSATRREYDMAMELAPELVRKETPCEVFVQTEQGDVQAAALRLARYWKSRANTFEERWLLPLNQTGTGALSMDDIEILRTGFLVVIPSSDGSGATALYDESKSPRQPGISLMRCTFYVTALYPTAFQNLTIVHIVTSKPRPPIDLRPARWDVLKQAMPMKITKLLIVQAFEGAEKQRLLDSLGYQELRATEYKSGKKGLPRIAGRSVRETLAQLQHVVGLSTKHIPVALGGSYDYQQQFHEWIRTRLSIEDVLSSAAPTARYRPSAVPQVTRITAVAKRGTLKRVSEDVTRRKYGHKTTTPKQAAEFARRERNALYSRRSFNKRKLEKLSLQNQIAVLTATNERIRMQNEQFQTALQQARTLVLEYQQRQQSMMNASAIMPFAPWPAYLQQPTAAAASTTQPHSQTPSHSIPWISKY